MDSHSLYLFNSVKLLSGLETDRLVKISLQAHTLIHMLDEADESDNLIGSTLLW